MCASVVQFVHILFVTPSYKTLLCLEAFYSAQRDWLNRLFLPDIPGLPPSVMEQVSLDRADGGLDLVPAYITAVPYFAGSKLDNARAVAQLPGQPDAASLTASIPNFPDSLYAERNVTPAEELLLPSL